MKKVRSKLRPIEIGVIKTFRLSPDDEVGEIAVQCRGCTYYYDNLAELCEKWEDMPEEPKCFWFITNKLTLQKVEPKNDWPEVDKKWVEELKKCGNYFEIEEEAEKAVEKLKAFMRLKDKGFRFNGYDVADGVGGGVPCGQVYFKAGNYDKEEIENDLYLLFGGEE